MPQYDTLLVPTDGSHHAEEAIETAFQIAEDSNADVYTLFVVDTTLYGEPALGSVELFIDQLEDAGAELLSELVGLGRERGIDVKRAVRHGDPADVIMAFADEIDTDLIVMGYQGESHRMKMGNVVEQVLDETDRHVLVI